MSNFASYSNMTELMTAIGNKFKAMAGVYNPKGNTTFALLPATITSSMLGNVYNVTDAFTSDSRFADGAGKDYPAGTNVAVFDVDTTGSSPDLKYDCLAGFIDLSDINTKLAAIEAMIAGTFDATSGAYAIGDVVIYNDGLYKFKAAHTAGDPWDATEVDSVTVDDLIAAAITTADSHIATAKAAVEAITAPEFAASNAYAAGDVVTHEDGLYKFTSAHTAGDPWDSTEVTATTVVALVTAAEPDQLTAAQIADLEALL